MMRVRRRISPETFVALEASLVALHVRRQLISRIAVVHRMTREAGEVAALKAGGFNHAIVVASRNPNDSVVPITFFKEFWIAFQGFLEPRLRFDRSGANDRRGLIQIISGPVRESILVVVGGAGNPLNAVTLTADLGGNFSRFSPRINNCGIRLAALMKMIAPQRVLICPHVLL